MGVSGDFVLKFEQASSSSGQITIDNVTWTSNGASLAAPNATSASNVAETSFTANWDAVLGATGYYLDVATDNSFNNMVSGYNNLDVGNVTSYSVTGLSASTTYYYRVRAYDGSTTSDNSNTITVTTSSQSTGTVTDIYISEVSDAPSSASEYIELYNPDNTAFDLTGAKLVRVKVSDNSSEYVYNIGTDGAGDTIIPAKGILIIARGASKSDFQDAWGITLASNVNYNTGDTNLYFGSPTARRWRLRMDGVKNSDTDDGTVIDDTNGAAGGSGNRTYKNESGNFVTEDDSNATPGEMDEDQPLPVTLSTFTANYVSGRAVLYWETQSESDNGFWNIYRANSKNFGQSVKINSQPIHGAGTTTQTTQYYYRDDSVSENMTYWYWLESVTFSGETVLFDAVELKIEQDSNEETPPLHNQYGLYQNMPNPFNPYTIIQFALPKTQYATIEIYNMKGEFIKEVFNGIAEGNRIYNIKWLGKDKNGRTISSGIYFYKLRTKNYTRTKKMLLLK